MRDEDKKATIDWLMIIGVLAVLGTCLYLVLVLSGCRTTTDPDAVSGAGPKVINCANRAVGENWTRAYPEVMKCLVGLIDSPISCLDAVPAVVKVGVDTVACIVRDTAKTAGMRAQSPEADVVTVRKAERAAAYLERRGFEFVE